MDANFRQTVLRAVDSAFDRQTDFLKQLCRFPSVRGHEQSIQLYLADALRSRGYETDVWEINEQDLAGLPGFSPVLKPYAQALNVVGKSTCRSRKGRSLILNGHVDVVPTGPVSMWSNHPFEPYVEEDWLYGRGAGDMKAGLSCNLFALDALASLGFRPAADCYLQFVVEEECTGNGALACLQRGYTADAALIPEPFGEALVTAQIGVLWLQVRLKGIPSHIAHASAGVNAIEAALPLISALRELETRWNDAARRPTEFEGVDHPLNLNIGRIEGGDWASSVPAWSTFDVRMAIYPGDDIDAAERELRQCIASAADRSDYLRQNPPEVICHGFRAEGYSLGRDCSEAATNAIELLAAMHQIVNGSPMARTPITATTDARYFGLYAGMPALVYGPVAERIHGYDERVLLDSVRRVTQSIALFIAAWCGLEPIERA
ncbi:MAG: ArgE/DapE family deacylase [Mesorhizobium sp.]|nr:MAG: ArgE/DapE family deacylase [Mesorhizobium sp.]